MPSLVWGLLWGSCFNTLGNPARSGRRFSFARLPRHDIFSLGTLGTLGTTLEILGLGCPELIFQSRETRDRLSRHKQVLKGSSGASVRHGVGDVVEHDAKGEA